MFDGDEEQEPRRHTDKRMQHAPYGQVKQSFQ